MKRAGLERQGTGEQDTTTLQAQQAHSSLDGGAKGCKCVSVALLFDCALAFRNYPISFQPHACIVARACGKEAQIGSKH
eukprot:15464753-Alexandrium_andersonii.AAC.1